MYDIAKAFGTTVDELKKYNNLDSNIIKVGQELFWETDDVQGVKDRLIAIEKIRLANEAKKNQLRYDPKIKAEQDKKLKEFTKEEDYGDLTQHQIRDYQNFKKMGLGKTVEDFKRYKQNESKSAQSLKIKIPVSKNSGKKSDKNTSKKNNWFTNAVIGTAMGENPSVMIASGWRQNENGDFVQDQQNDPGVIALRNNLAVIGASALLTNPIAQSVVNNPITRSIAGSQIGQNAAKQAGLGETSQKVAGYLGGGFGGLSKNVFNQALDLGLKQGGKYLAAEGLSNTIGYAAAGEAYDAADKAKLSNTIKVPLAMLSGFWGRRGFNSALRNSVKNTKLGQNLIQQKAYDPTSAFSSQGHVQPKIENTNRMIDYYLNQLPQSTKTKIIQAPIRGIVKGLHTINPNDKILSHFLNGTVYTGAQALKSAPIIATGLATGVTIDGVSKIIPKEYKQPVSDAAHFVMPVLLNKSFGTFNNFNRGSANFVTYSSGGTGAGIQDALQNAAKIALGKPQYVNTNLLQLTKPQLAKGLALSFWDSLPIHRTSNGFGRKYKPGGYGLLYWTNKNAQSGNWSNLNTDLYQGQNPISHMFVNAPLGQGVVSTNKYFRPGTNPGTQFDALLNTSFGKAVRYGDRPIEVVITGNKVDTSKGSWGTNFNKSGKVMSTSRNQSDAKVRPSSYNADTGVRRLGHKTSNLAVNTKGQPAAVYIDKQGRQFSVGTDLYGVGSGKKTLFESMYGSFMDAHTNPIITVSFNKYTPTKSRMGGTQSFGTEVFKNIPIYAE